MNTVRLVSISTPRGVEQAFILIKPDHPVASVVLFAGSARRPKGCWSSSEFLHSLLIAFPKTRTRFGHREAAALRLSRAPNSRLADNVNADTSRTRLFASRSIEQLNY